MRPDPRHRRPRRRWIPIGIDAPLWLNLLWIAAFALAVAIAVRVPHLGWRLGLLEIAFVVVSLGVLAGALVAARRREGGRRPRPPG